MPTSGHFPWTNKKKGKTTSGSRIKQSHRTENSLNLITSLLSGLSKHGRTARCLLDHVWLDTQSRIVARLSCGRFGNATRKRVTLSRRSEMSDRQSRIPFLLFAPPFTILPAAEQGCGACESIESCLINVAAPVEGKFVNTVKASRCTLSYLDGNSVQYRSTVQLRYLLL